MNAIEIKKNARYNGDDFCKYLALEKHILTKQTRENVIRFTPPLTISPNDFTQCIGKINETIKSLKYKDNVM
jgi:acetylornithine/succinyldiaminopimelate/putrescine aminotransferase